MRAEAALQRVARRRREGQPFLLSPSGRPDRRVNGWFASLEMRSLARSTWRKYATCLRVWLNFLECVDTAWDEATPSRVENFKSWRLQDPGNDRRVRAGTVHTDLTVLKQFYGWAQRTHGVVSPVLMRTLYVPGAGKVEKVAAAPAAVRDSDVKWFDPQGYARYRDLGLLGLTADGVDDPSWRGRNPQRDAAFAEGLYGTGLRLTEWASVLDVELPDDDPDRQYRTCRLADGVAKGGYGRRYWMPRSVLTETLSYIEGERARAVGRARVAGRYERLDDVLVMVRVLGRRRMEVRSSCGAVETVSLDVLAPWERRRLFREGEEGLEPVAVWLNEDGTPRAPHGWHHTFATANRRLARMGLAGFAGAPHMLRHSFALRWFAVGRMIYGRRVAHLSGEETKDFRAEFGSTWSLVQTLLGHRNPQTTMAVYLEPFRSLEVELLLSHAEGVAASTLLGDLFAGEPRVLGDPFAEPELAARAGDGAWEW
ncbi:site-specific integrase [Spirillospora sp. NPDC000708]